MRTLLRIVVEGGSAAVIVMPGVALCVALESVAHSQGRPPFSRGY